MLGRLFANAGRSRSVPLHRIKSSATSAAAVSIVSRGDIMSPRPRAVCAAGAWQSAACAQSLWARAGGDGKRGMVIAQDMTEDEVCAIGLCVQIETVLRPMFGQICVCLSIVILPTKG